MLQDVWGLGLQILFGIIILKIPFIKKQFFNIDKLFKKFEEKQTYSDVLHWRNKM